MFLLHLSCECPHVYAHARVCETVSVSNRECASALLPPAGGSCSVRLAGEPSAAHAASGRSTREFRSQGGLLLGRRLTGQAGPPLSPPIRDPDPQDSLCHPLGQARVSTSGRDVLTAVTDCLLRVPRSRSHPEPGSTAPSCCATLVQRGGLSHRRRDSLPHTLSLRPTGWEAPSIVLNRPGPSYQPSSSHFPAHKWELAGPCGGHQALTGEPWSPHQLDSHGRNHVQGCRNHTNKGKCLQRASCMPMAVLGLLCMSTTLRRQLTDEGD